MGTCREPLNYGTLFGDANGKNDADGQQIDGPYSWVMSLIYIVSTQSTEAVRIAALVYAITTFCIFVMFFTRAVIQYVSDICAAFMPKWAYATTGFSIGVDRKPQSDLWLQTDLSIMTMWSILKFLIGGILLPIPTSILWPLWLPIVVLVVGSRIAKGVLWGVSMALLSCCMISASHCTRLAVACSEKISKKIAKRAARTDSEHGEQTTPCPQIPPYTEEELSLELQHELFTNKADDSTLCTYLKQLDADNSVNDDDQIFEAHL